MRYCTLRSRIGDGWAFNEFSAPNKSTVNEQIVEIMIHSSKENFQLELQPYSEQKVDEMHVSPAIAKSPCNLKKTVEAVKKVVK